MAFNEDWYSDEQLELLSQTYRSVRDVPGMVLEIGCWEGKSTVALASGRDVYRAFCENMQRHTAGNVVPRRADWRAHFAQAPVERVAFCHIDASHDYRSVRETILTLLPRMSPGGLLCGDDFLAAHAERTDLDGGVERAVRECLPRFSSCGQFWWAAVERS